MMASSRSALKWLSDIGASPVMLDRIGKVVSVTGPTAPSDARLRLAQARALSNGTALAISKELISAKVRGQETPVRDELKNSAAADAITGFRVRLDNADNLDSVRTLEAHAAVAYWNAWRDLPILWPKSDLRRVPHHWTEFGTRASPLTGGRESCKRTFEFHLCRLRVGERSASPFFGLIQESAFYIFHGQTATHWPSRLWSLYAQR